MDLIVTLHSQTKADILIIAGCWLKKSMLNSYLALTGYKVYRSDRVGRGGGVSIVVHNNLNVSVSLSNSVQKQF